MPEFSYNFENRGLLIARPGDVIPDGFWANFLNGTSQKSGYVECRQGTSRVSATNLTLVHSQGRQIVVGVPKTYQGAGTVLYRTFASIATGFSGNPITFRDLAIEFAGTPYIVAFDSTKRVKDTGSAVTNFGFPGGTAAASAVAATAQTKIIAPSSAGVPSFEYATSGDYSTAWPATSATITRTTTDPAVGTSSGNIAVVASTTGYINANEASQAASFPLDLSQFSAPGDSDDSDSIVFWLRIDDASSLVEIRVEFDVDTSTNDFTRNYYWKSVQSSQISPAVDQQVTAETIRNSLITSAAFQDPDTLATLDERVNQLLAEYLAAGVNQWTQIAVKKSEFTRVGSSANDWGDVNAIRVQIQTNAGGTVNVGIDSMYMQGGIAQNLVGDYDWIYQYENSVTATRSPFNAAMAAQVSLDKTKATVTVQNPTDTQADYIRLYRRGGDNPEDYLLAVRQLVTTWSGTVAITDGVPDSDLGEVAEFATGSDQIELSNAGTTEIEPTICEMHMDRLWVNDTNYPDRLWYSDRGASETFREDQFILSKSGQGDPIRRPFALDDQMFIFTTKTVKRVGGSGPESFESLNTGAELGLFSLNAICKGDNRIFFRTYDGIVSMTSSGYPVKLTSDIDPLFHGQLLNDYSNLVAVDDAYASSERLEYFDSKLRFSYTGTDGSRYELVRDFETERWEQTDIGATSYLRLDDVGEIYAARSDGYVYSIDQGLTDNGTNIEIDFQTRFFDFDIPGAGKYLTAVIVDCDLGGQTIAASIETDNGEGTPATQNITSNGRTLVQFPVNSQIACTNFSFRATGDNGGVRIRFYKVIFEYILLPTSVKQSLTDWDDSGYGLDKIYRVLKLEIDTFTANVSIGIQIDDVAVQTSTVNTSARKIVEISLPVDTFGRLSRLALSSASAVFKYYSHTFDFIQQPLKPTIIATDWIDSGYPGDKRYGQLQLEINTYGEDVTVDLEVDDEVIQTITVNTTGRQMVQTSLVSTAIGRLSRLSMSGSDAFFYYGHSFDFMKDPLQTTRIDTWELDFGYTRWKFIRRLWVAANTPGSVTLTIYIDGTLSYSVDFDVTGDVGWRKTMLKLPPGLKGKLFRFVFTSSSAFKIFLDQSDVEWHALSTDRTYQRARLQRVT